MPQHLRSKQLSQRDLMAAHCLAITAISSVLSGHLDVINETNLYKTCSAIHTGNRGHLDVLALLRSHHLGALTPGAEGQIDVPPFYQVCLEVRLELLYDVLPELIPNLDRTRTCSGRPQQ